MKNEKKIANTFLCLTAMVALLIGSGCSTTNTTQSGSGMIPTHNDKLSVEEKLLLLTISTEFKADEKLSKSLAYNLEASLNDTLVKKGLEVTKEGADLVLFSEVGCELFDKTGDFYLYEGDILSDLKLANGNKLKATKRFEGKGKREVGKKKAIDSCIKDLEKDFVPWAVKSLEDMRLELVSSTITFVNLRGTIFNKDYKIQSEKVQHFVKSVEKIEGVYTCKLVEQSYKLRMAKFKIIYDKEHFPESLLVKLDCDDELNLKKVK